MADQYRPLPPGGYRSLLFNYPMDDSTSIKTTLQAALSRLQEDDVFNQKWLETVCLVTQPSQLSPHDLGELFQTLIEHGVRHVISHSSIGLVSVTDMTVYHSLSPPSSSTPTGPYLAVERETGLDLYQAYRLYPDRYRCFVFGMYPLEDGNGAYKPFRRVNEEGYNLIPVPSRMYTEGARSGIVGQRIAIKGSSSSLHLGYYKSG
jgi:hypothetical protein